MAKHKNYVPFIDAAGKSESVRMHIISKHRSLVVSYDPIEVAANVGTLLRELDYLLHNLETDPAYRVVARSYYVLQRLSDASGHSQVEKLSANYPIED